MTYLQQTIMAVFLMVSGVQSAMAAEEAKYTVVLKEQNFEVRAYESHVLAETLVAGGFASAGNKAFARLFKYITGNNISQQKIPMTAPVTQAVDSEKIAMTSSVSQQQVNDQWAVSFMMPASSSLETLPQPKDSRIVLRHVPAKHIAAVRYSGSWREKSYQDNSDALYAWINKKGFKLAGEAQWARYNPPFTLWFLRRNEILVPIDMPLATQ